MGNCIRLSKVAFPDNKPQIIIRVENLDHRWSRSTFLDTKEFKIIDAWVREHSSRSVAHKFEEVYNSIAIAKYDYRRKPDQERTLWLMHLLFQNENDLLMFRLGFSEQLAQNGDIFSWKE